MKRKDRSEVTRTDPRVEERDPKGRTVAPPIEREHETQAGVFEEEEKRQDERED
jgi:hypothetical protein